MKNPQDPTASRLTPVLVTERHPEPQLKADPATEGKAGCAAEPERPSLARFDARGVCLVTLTVLAVLFALKSAQAFIVPIVLAIVTAYALDPVVAFLERRRLPRMLGAFLVMMSLMGGMTFGALSMQQQVADIVNTLPEISTQISRTFKGYSSDSGSVIDKVRAAAAVFHQEEPRGRGSRVVVERSGSDFNNLLLAGSMGVATFVGQAIMVIFLIFFLLIAGNTFKRKFVKVAGNTLTQKKISVHMLDAINRSIQHYMLMMLLTNVALALLSWAAFKWIGLENASTWAVFAGALHVIPYFGSLLTALATGVAALIQFGEIGPALLTAGASLIIATLIGVVATTWMTGRIARMNVVAVFVLLLLFTWVWGIWGTLLSIPIAFIAKVVSDHVEGLEAVSEFLGE